jgi:hypothetical protein
LENLDGGVDNDSDVDISRSWERIRKNMKASAAENVGNYELEQHKPWFDEEFSKL